MDGVDQEVVRYSKSKILYRPLEGEESRGDGRWTVGVENGHPRIDQREKCKNEGVEAGK